jgi:catechol 2,3-dioxygenase-like lactoylglutathione lyase family enzyme
VGDLDGGHPTLPTMEHGWLRAEVWPGRELAEAYPMTAADHDRVILVVALDVRADGARLAGHPRPLHGGTETAVAWAVSVPLARGVRDIQEAAPRHAVESAPDVDRRLAFLDEHGIHVRQRRSS